MAPPALPWPEAEWLEPDGSGGFASGTAGLVRTRRYHALLLTAADPPSRRVVLVNGIEAAIETAQGRTPVSRQRYAPDTIHPDAAASLRAFAARPWPCWTFALAGGGTATQEILVDPASGDTLLRWRSDTKAELTVRLLLSGRDYHALHRENPGFDFTPAIRFGNAAWHPYPGLPGIAALSNGTYQHDPLWYRRFLYSEEQARGLDCIEDLASPGVFRFTLGETDAVLVLRVGDALAPDAGPYAARVFAAEAARRGAATDPAPEAYVARRAGGHTLIAGFPWFTDWGRDSFIALRGLLLATGRAALAESLLLAWSDLVVDGLLPNRFADQGPPEYNTGDASLWFAVAVHDLFRARDVGPAVRARLQQAIGRILAGHLAGTRFGIGADADGLLCAGEPGTQLTWMDARADGVAVTPRVGKPVEIQALWYNALRIAAAWDPVMAPRAERARRLFLARFLDPASGGLYDVVDVDGTPGVTDPALRPNQIFAVGGLPFALLEGAAARSVVDLVEARLLTPFGLRTLDRNDPRYVPRYLGAPAARDGAYHQGTVWPWLIGPFVEAWLRVHGDSAENRATARARFLPALADYRSGPGFGHLPEITDAEPPHAPRGCPAQAWSLGEFLRAWRMTEAP